MSSITSKAKDLARKNRRRVGKALAGARREGREVPGPSPNPATNLLIADIAVLGIGMIGHSLGRLVDIAHGRQHRIGHHREQQQCQRRQAQESAELA